MSPSWELVCCFTGEVTADGLPTADRTRELCAGSRIRSDRCAAAWLRRCWPRHIALTGCTAEATPPPSACFDGDQVRRALARVPGAVRLSDGTSLSRCVRLSTGDEQLQSLGVILTGIADELADHSETGDVRFAAQLGFLLGAAERGANAAQGVQDSRTSPDGSRARRGARTPQAPRRRAAVRAGRRRRSARGMSRHVRLRLFHHRDGARVAYREAGAGPGLVLWHSALLSHREFTPLVEGLQHRFRVVLPDLPLHGDSEDRPRHPYTLDWLAEVIAACSVDVAGPQTDRRGARARGRGRAARARARPAAAVEARVDADSPAPPGEGDAGFARWRTAREPARSPESTAC